MGKACGTQESANRWLNTDFCGLFCACMVYFLLCFGEYTFVFIVVGQYSGFDNLSGKLHAGLFTLFITLAFMSHLKTMFSNPGAVPQRAVPLDYKPDEDSKAFKTCMRCKAFKPKRSHHCSICKRCIVKMDHHCPWVNNCVGIGNHKYFLLFLLYCIITSVYAVIMQAANIYYCSQHSTPVSRLRGRPTRHPINIEVDPRCDDYNFTHTVLLFCMCLQGVLFGLFTVCMMCDQSTVVFTAMTQIDRFKSYESNVKVAPSQVRKNFAEVFGGDPGKKYSLFQIICFFLPTTPDFVDWNEMVGYEENNADTSWWHDTVDKFGGNGNRDESRYKPAENNGEVSQRLKS